MARLTGDLQRLGRYVSDRVAELGLTQEQVQELGGPSPATLRLIMSGGRKSLQPSSVGGLERALQWASGSVRAILAEGEPTPLTSAEQAMEARGIDTRNLDPRILAVLRDDVWSDEEKAWIIQTLPPRKDQTEG